MAYDSLKALIRQYIKTNGEQEITGQILQNVLVEMVNQYPSTDGYATQSWVTSQLAGYATQSWVWESLADDTNEQIASSHLTTALSAYATITQLGNYLRLTGGTLTGGLNISDGSHGYAQLFVDEDGLNIMTGSLTGTQQLYTGRIYSDSTIEATGSITGFSFIKNGGTSAQFLKADGSVDSTVYLPKQGNSFYFITDADMPETAANISTLNAAHRMTLYRNAILMPYQMNDANDGGFIRSRGTSESSAILEIGMWDDSGAGETIQFNYYPTTSTVNPTYSISVPKKTGTIALTSDLASYNPTTNFKTINNQSIIGTGNINIEGGGGGGAYYDAEIEYLEGTGTQYINTGIKLFESSPTSLEISMKVFVNTGQTDLSTILNAMEEIAPYPGIVIRTYNNNIQIVRDGGQNPITISSCGSVQNITRTENNLSSVNDVPVTLFASLDANNAPWRYCKLKLYSLSIKRNSVLVFDAIPVRVGQVGYLYDKVSGELFGNSGTGDFVLGQDTGPGGGLPYLPLTGGTITGNLTVDSTLATSVGRLDVWAPQNYDNLPRCLFIIQNVEWARLEMDTSAAFHFKHGSTDNTYSRIYAASFNQASDLRKKTIMGDVPMNIYNVANAPLFKFTWNNETKYSGQHIGSAAQYWQTVLPELVSIGRDADMTLAMQYDVIALASAITVAKTVVNHEERIILLERENEALRQEIADLKSA